LWLTLIFTAEADNRPKSAHRYNVAEQQQIYRSEIDRIWKAQFDSLSNKVEPELSEDEEEKKDRKVRFSSSRPEGHAPTPGASTVHSPVHAPSPAAASPPFRAPSVASSQGPYSREASMEPDDTNLVADMNSSKVLVIKRMKDGVQTAEVIRDQVVINAYQKKRESIEEEQTTTDQLEPTGDADRDGRAKKKCVCFSHVRRFCAWTLTLLPRLHEELARMKKNQERRLVRKNAKLAAEGGQLLNLKRAKPDTTRRCGNCGQIGHMSACALVLVIMLWHGADGDFAETNRKCPRWAEFNQPLPPGATAPVPTPAPAAISPSKPGGSGSTSLFAPPGGLRAGTFSSVPSPLATSPPMSGMDVDDVQMDDAPASSSAAPKIKLKLNRS